MFSTSLDTLFATEGDQRNKQNVETPLKRKVDAIGDVPNGSAPKQNQMIRCAIGEALKGSESDDATPNKTRPAPKAKATSAKKAKKAGARFLEIVVFVN